MSTIKQNPNSAKSASGGKIAIIIPAYNEGEVIANTLCTVRSHLRGLPAGRQCLSPEADLVVVNDGSSDNTGEIATRLADYVLTHRHNCGLGAALATGIEYARRQGYEALVTFDSDGQHDPADIGKAIAMINKGYDVVIGSRFIGSHTNMPRGRGLLLKFSNLITFLFFGVATSDSQSGFRALSRQAIDSISIKSNRMEVSSEFFGEVKRLRLKLIEIPIHIRYTKYSLHKGQKNTNGMGVLLKLLYILGR